MRRLYLLLATLALPLTACNENTALGNDREAQLDPAPTPAPIMGAAQALQNVATELIKPETMSQADIAALGGLMGKCTIKLTEVAHPSLVFVEGESATIKLNGKLIPLPSAGSGRYESGGLSVTLEPNGEEGDAGLQGMDMIVVPPEAKDEIGYGGYVHCSQGEKS